MSIPATESDDHESHATRLGVSKLFSRAYLMEEVDPEQSTIPLAAYCFMTGYIDVICYSAASVWAGFQTGNSAQLAISLARLITGPTGFRFRDQFALTSVLSFLFGASFGRLADRIGAKTHTWLFFGTMLQALFTVGAAVAARMTGHDKVVSVGLEDVVWTSAAGFVAVGFMSASLGLQGIMGKRVNTQFATTVVLTAVWCELVADPKLFQLRRPGTIRTRDHKILAIFSLVMGCFLGRVILQFTTAGITLGIAVVLRAVIALSWLVVPSAMPEKAKTAIPRPISQERLVGLPEHHSGP